MWHVSCYMSNIYSTSSPWHSSAAAGKACLYYFKAFQPWPPGTLLRDEGRQERGAQQGCGREIQRINGAARCELKPGPAGKWVSSCLASPGADTDNRTSDPLSNGWRQWVTRRLQHLGTERPGRRRRQAAAVMLSCRRRRQSNPASGEPAVAAWGGGREGCERIEFLSLVHGDAMHLSGGEWIQLSLNRRRAGGRAGISPASSWRAIWQHTLPHCYSTSYIYLSLYNIVIQYIYIYIYIYI